MLRLVNWSSSAAKRNHEIQLRLQYLSNGFNACRSYATDTQKPLFDKILIANRGEIACRIMKTAKLMGIKSVAVFSEADRYSKHVSMADEAYLIGPPPSSESYLCSDKIIQVAKQTGAQAIHPGYGFLSENASFANELSNHGIEFIGPPSKAIIAMGSKSKSKEIMEAAGVPCVPGYHGKNQGPEFLRQQAEKIGYPILIKAVSGGGGKGMRIVYNSSEFESALRSAKSEALKSFKDDIVLLEKYIPEGRHVEVQILADKFGHTLHLFERDCSVQRRHQKVIEEAPAPNISDELRKNLGEKAVAAAKAVGYYSAGTVEFLLFGEKFYFLEMNTRLQVEHPITEMITGIDLVEQMLKVAAGKKLQFKQENIKKNGWSFEARVYAEDPEKYLPSIGTLSKYIEPTEILGNNNQKVRCDSGIVEGSEISIYYDPMICKLVTHGKNRKESLEIMKAALDSYVIKGVTHNIPLLRDIVVNDRFQKGDLSTKFLPQEYPEGFKGHQLSEKTLSELAIVAGIIHVQREIRNYQKRSNSPNQWTYFVQVMTKDSKVLEVPINIKLQSDFNSNMDNIQLNYIVSIHGKENLVNLNWKLESPIIQAKIIENFQNFNDLNPFITLQYLESLPLGYRLQHNGTQFEVKVLNSNQKTYSNFMIEKPKMDFSKVILSPMPGSVVSVAVKVGDEVAEGSEVAVIEAMKMANILRASRVGKIKSVHVQPGCPVAADQVIIEFEDDK